jgi:hypothetical protein
MVSGCFPSIPLAAELIHRKKVTEKIETKLQTRFLKRCNFYISQSAIIR